MLRFKTKRSAIAKMATGLLSGLFLLAVAPAANAGEGYFYKEGTIWRAAQDGDLPKVEKMLVAKPSLLNGRETGYIKDTLLEAAAHGGNAPVFRYLIGRRAALTKDQIMLHAAAGGNMEIIKFVAARGAKINARRKESGDTPLMWAAQDHGKVDVLKFLVSKGADVRAKQKQGLTATVYACFPGRDEKNRLATLQYLYSQGGKATAVGLTMCAQASWGLESTDWNAIKSTQFLLQEGISPNETLSGGWSPVLISVAAQIGRPSASNKARPFQWDSNLKILQLLLAAKANPNVRDRWKATPLQNLLSGPFAVKINKIPVEKAAALLLKYGADPDLKDKNGDSPRSIAQKYPEFAKVAALFAKVSNPAAMVVTSPKPTAAPVPAVKPISDSQKIVKQQDEVRAGEICLYGKLTRVIDATSKEISAKKFVLPNGKFGRIKPAKTKTIVITNATIMQTVGNAQPLALNQISPRGGFWSVIGKDEGSGKPLIARRITLLFIDNSP